MDYKRAILFAFIAYIASFIIGIITMVILGFDFETSTDIPNSLWYIGMITTSIIMIPVTYWYFLGKKTVSNMVNGFYFGLITLATGFILDGIPMLLFTVSNEGAPTLIDYYTNVLFWVTVLLMVLTSTVVGKFMEK